MTFATLLQVSSETVWLPQHPAVIPDSQVPLMFVHYSIKSYPSELQDTQEEAQSRSGSCC